MLETNTINSSITTFLDLCPLNSFGLTKEEIKFFNPNFWYIEKFNWDYIKALNFQKFCVNFLRNHSKIKIFIFTSHPHCFTLGRGLQKHKDKDNDHQDLVEFNPAIETILPFPVHRITRGGGITFHYPGQWVCYPIINLNGKEMTVYGLMTFILERAKNTLEEIHGPLNLNYEKTLLGLWHGEKKLASIGLSVKRFITYHGMALNIFKDATMIEALKLVNPCGLPSEIFTQLEAIVPNNQVSLNDFHISFKNKIFESISLLNN